jgi:excisionase family DNA binding protein
MKSSIITTAQAAQILGVSPRTAQLWTESGVIPSWKTPGGHRRMFEADVQAVLNRNDQIVVAPRRVLVLAPVQRQSSWTQALAALEVTQVSFIEEPIAAAVALGATVPDVFIVEAENLHTLPQHFLGTLRNIALLSRLQIVIATRAATDGAPPALDPAWPFKLIELEQSPDKLAAQLADHTRLKPLRLLPLPAELRNAPFPVSPNEAGRLMAVHRSGILDSANEETLDSLTRIASLSLAAPIALITVLSEDRQWFKAKVGLEMRETPRSWAFCNYTVLQSDIQQFPNLASDPRFADNPAVNAAPHFRFYAGAPITDEQGYALGSLCIIDTKPRQLDATQTEILGRLARLATAEINRGARAAATRR